MAQSTKEKNNAVKWNWDCQERGERIIQNRLFQEDFTGVMWWEGHHADIWRKVFQEDETSKYKGPEAAKYQAFLRNNKEINVGAAESQRGC